MREGTASVDLPCLYQFRVVVEELSLIGKYKVNIL